MYYLQIQNLLQNLVYNQSFFQTKIRNNNSKHNMNNALEVSLNSLEKAKYYKNKENYGRSFAHYLVFLELSPNDRNQNEFDFLEVLFKWVNILEKRNQIENMFKCYLQALNYFPSNIEIIHNLGAHLLR